jgi:hypothetical protein
LVKVIERKYVSIGPEIFNRSSSGSDTSNYEISPPQQNIKRENFTQMNLRGLKPHSQKDIELKQKTVPFLSIKGHAPRKSAQTLKFVFDSYSNESPKAKRKKQPIHPEKVKASGQA